MTSTRDSRSFKAEAVRKLLVMKRLSAPPMRSLLAGMMPVCGIGKPSGRRNRATTANQSAQAPTMPASAKARRYGSHTQSTLATLVAMKIAVIRTSSSVATVRMRRSPRRSITARSSRNRASADGCAASAASVLAAALAGVAVGKEALPAGKARRPAATRQVLIIELAHDARAIAAFEPPDGEVPAGDALKVIHEQHIDRRAADGAEQRHGACRRALGDDDAEARGDFAHQAADRGRGQVGGAAFEQAGGGGGGEAGQQRARGG